MFKSSSSLLRVVGQMKRKSSGVANSESRLNEKTLMIITVDDFSLNRRLRKSIHGHHRYR